MVVTLGALVLVGGGAMWALTRSGDGARASVPHATAPAADAAEPSELGEIAPQRTDVARSVPEAEAPAIAVEAPRVDEAPRRGLVLGRFVDQNERPVAGVPVQVWIAAEYGVREPLPGKLEPPVPVGESSSDAIGAWSFELAYGDYVLSYGDGRFQVSELGVWKVDSAQRSFDVALPALASIEITVRRDDNAVAPAVAVTAWRDGAGDVRLQTDAWGIARAAHLPPGEYRWCAIDPVLGRADVAFVLEGGKETRVEMILRRRSTW